MAQHTSPSNPGEAGSAFVIEAEGRARLVLSGEIDVALSAELTEAITEAGKATEPIEVDARNVTFMDSSGVALLARLAHRSPGRLVIIQPPEVVRFLLEITRLGDLISVVDEDPGFPGAAEADAVT